MSLRYNPGVAPRKWTPREDSDLRHYRFEGLQRDVIAKTMNRSAGSVESRMRKLGLAIGFSSSRKWASRESAPVGPAGKPLDLGSRDVDFVEACLAQGSFASMTQLGDGRILFGHAGKAWVQP